jgi:RimJ/RimL family protein N-acetyltransferase
MQYEKIFSRFPILEGENIRLRNVTASDVLELFRMLGDKDIIEEYSPIGRYHNIQQVADNFLFSPDINFENRSSILWAIEDKKSSKIVGVRELFIDNPTKPVTVQGFVGKEYRKNGFSKEAYNLIINFARYIGASGILANSSIENYPAIALMHSVGFSQNYVSIAKDGMRVVFIHDLEDFNEPVFPNGAIKRISIFCKMHLFGTNIRIKEDGLIKTDTGINKNYLVSLLAKNTLGLTLYHIFDREIAFYSDGQIIRSIEDGEYIATIDGETDFIDAWHYAWNLCIKE